MFSEETRELILADLRREPEFQVFERVLRCVLEATSDTQTLRDLIMGLTKDEPTGLYGIGLGLAIRLDELTKDEIRAVMEGPQRHGRMYEAP